MLEYITDDIEISSNDSRREALIIFMKKIIMKKIIFNK